MPPNAENSVKQFTDVANRKVSREEVNQVSWEFNLGHYKLKNKCLLNPSGGAEEAVGSAFPGAQEEAPGWRQHSEVDSIWITCRVAPIFCS